MLAFSSAFDRNSVYVTDKEGVITLSMDLPGVKKEDVTLTIDRGILSVKGERKSQEFKYMRRWQLADNLDSEAITAALEDGVLIVTIPRKSGQIARTIPVS